LIMPCCTSSWRFCSSACRWSISMSSCKQVSRQEHTAASKTQPSQKVPEQTVLLEHVFYKHRRSTAAKHVLLAATSCRPQSDHAQQHSTAKAALTTAAPGGTSSSTCMNSGNTGAARCPPGDLDCTWLSLNRARGLPSPLLPPSWRPLSPRALPCSDTHATAVAASCCSDGPLLTILLGMPAAAAIRLAIETRIGL
jgi:hypothetical protein